MVMLCTLVKPAGKVAWIIGLDGSLDSMGVYSKLATATAVAEPVLYEVTWTVQPIGAPTTPPAPWIESKLTRRT